MNISIAIYKLRLIVKHDSLCVSMINDSLATLNDIEWWFDKPSLRIDGGLLISFMMIMNQMVCEMLNLHDIIV